MKNVFKIFILLIGFQGKLCAQFGNFSVNSNITILQGTTLTVTGDLTINPGGVIENNGTLDIKGDWLNNSGGTGLNTVGQGIVLFSGDTQNIGGNTPTLFYTVSFSGTGNKTLLTDAEITNDIALNDRKLHLINSTLLLSSTNANNISFSSGFFSTGATGKLRRNTAAAIVYTLPLGDMATNRFRPVQIEPTTNNNHLFEVNLRYSNPTSSGYDVSNLTSPLCAVNSNFFIELNRISGNDGFYFTTYANPTVEGTFNNIVTWNNSWSIAAGQLSTISNFGLSGLKLLGLSSFPAILNLGDNSTLQPVIQFQGIPPLCNGSTATLQLNQPYTSYNWSNGATTATITVNQTDNYSVTVSNANGCTGSSTPLSVNFTNATAPSVSATNNGVICNTQPVTISVSGTYTAYNWSNGATTSTISTNVANSYSVTVTDNNGCTATNTLQVNASSINTPVIVSNSGSTICWGGSLELSLTNTYTSYAWSNNATTATINITQPGTYLVTVTDNNGCTASSSIIINQGSVSQQPVISSSGAGNLCTNATATLSVSPSFSTYNWSTSATTTTIDITTAGTYSVTVADNNSCTASASITVVAGNVVLPNILSSNGNNICTGNNTILSLDNNYTTYEWSNGVTASSITVDVASSYNVTVTDANGCTAQASSPINIQVNNAIVPVIVLSGNDTICSGETSLFTTQQSFNNYEWSNGATTASVAITTSDVYSVTTTDANGCTAISSNVDFTVLPLPIISFNVSNTQNLCTGDSIKVIATAGYDSYLWNTGETSFGVNLYATGTYYLTVTDADGCVGIDSVLINRTELNNPVADFTYVTNNSEVIFTDNSTDGTSYNWDFAGLDSSDIANPVYDFNGVGTFEVCLTVSNNCASDTKCENIQIITTGITLINDITINIYPNPTSDIMNIVMTNSNNDQINILMYDAIGKIVYAKSDKGTVINHSIDMSNLSSGNYIIKVIGDTINHSQKVQKL